MILYMWIILILQVPTSVVIKTFHALIIFNLEEGNFQQQKKTCMWQQPIKVNEKTVKQDNTKRG